jgi:hypothetical protein
MRNIPQRSANNRLQDPLLGASGPYTQGSGNMFTRVTDLVQGTGKFTNAIIACENIGATTLSEWQIDQFSRIGRLAAVGLTATAVLIQLGANDTQAGTT